MLGTEAPGTQAFWFTLGHGQVPSNAFDGINPQRVLPPTFFWCHSSGSLDPKPRGQVHFKFITYQILERQQVGILYVGRCPPIHNGSRAGFPNLSIMTYCGRGGVVLAL